MIEEGLCSESPEASLDEVAHDGTANAFGHDETKPARRKLIGNNHRRDKARGAELRTFSGYRPEVLAIHNAVSPR